MKSDTKLALEMLRRSYFAVDGLWFMMMEEAYDTQATMEIDERVWTVMAKIQVRKARELCDCKGESVSELVRCLTLKLTAEGHEFAIEQTNGNTAELVIRRCPWREVLEKADRTYLGPLIADHICATEAAVWAREFSSEGMSPIASELAEAMCHGAEHCRMVFRAALEGRPSA